MNAEYGLVFVPAIQDRKKITPLRKKACNLTYSTQALQILMHMSLTRGVFLKNYNKFIEDLTVFCKKQKPFSITAKKRTSVLPDRFWSGIHINSTKKLINLQKNLEKIINKHAVKQKKLEFIPHITLTFPAKVEQLKPVKNPVQKMDLSRITLVKKQKPGGKSLLAKHIKLS